MAIDNGLESGKLICGALGLDPAQVTGVTIVWEPGNLPFARVELLLNEGVVYELIQLRPVEHFALRSWRRWRWRQRRRNGAEA